MLSTNQGKTLSNQIPGVGTVSQMPPLEREALEWIVDKIQERAREGKSTRGSAFAGGLNTKDGKRLKPGKYSIGRCL